AAGDGRFDRTTSVEQRLGQPGPEVPAQRGGGEDGLCGGRAAGALRGGSGVAQSDNTILARPDCSAFGQRAGAVGADRRDGQAVAVRRTGADQRAGGDAAELGAAGKAVFTLGCQNFGRVSPEKVRGEFAGCAGQDKYAGAGSSSFELPASASETNIGFVEKVGKGPRAAACLKSEMGDG